MVRLSAAKQTTPLEFVQWGESFGYLGGHKMTPVKGQMNYELIVI